MSKGKPGHRNAGFRPAGEPSSVRNVAFKWCSSYFLQSMHSTEGVAERFAPLAAKVESQIGGELPAAIRFWDCLLYTSDAADDLLCVDLGGRRIIKKKNVQLNLTTRSHTDL